ncbi:inorganic pyrophosphatase [Listeria booriae]|uniref:inorganic diphosphatase n=1 Tax=Listeria booriae TaxID=1552123 RepID=UPI001624A841|nr:inorganic diphosphatase [Listeria booriae]MBC2181344.1 inorganic pyrophosphatase [Listeria booriae]
MTMEKLKLRVTIDRPIGFKDDYGNTYPINYGFVPGVIAGDGEEQDVYIISKNATTPLDIFEGILVAVIHRKNDTEDKWVVTSKNELLSKQEISEKTHFLEQYFDSVIEIL